MAIAEGRGDPVTDSELFAAALDKVFREIGVNTSYVQLQRVTRAAVEVHENVIARIGMSDIRFPHGSEDRLRAFAVQLRKLSERRGTSPGRSLAYLDAAEAFDHAADYRY